MSFVIVLSLCLSGGQFSHGHGKDQRRGTLIAVTVLYFGAGHRRFPRPPPCGRSRQASASARRFPRAAARRLLPGGRARQKASPGCIPSATAQSYSARRCRRGAWRCPQRALPEGGDLLGGIICNAGSLATLTISATDTPSAAASLQRIAMLGLAASFSISTSIPLLMLARRDSSSSDIFRFTVGLQPRGDGATYLVDIRS